MPHFLLVIRKKISTPTLHDAAIAAIQQRYYNQASTDGTEVNLVYVICQGGSAWYEKQYREQGNDPQWYRRAGTNFDTARKKAIQETLHAFVPPEHRQRLRWATDPEVILNVVRESLLEQIGALLMQPTSSYDRESLAQHWTRISICAQRLESFPLLAQSASQQFPFSPILPGSEFYPAYDLTVTQHTNSSTEYAIACTA